MVGCKDGLRGRGLREHTERGHGEITGFHLYGLEYRSAFFYEVGIMLHWSLSRKAASELISEMPPLPRKEMQEAMWTGQIQTAGLFA